MEAERLAREGHCLVPGLKGDDPLLGPLDDALGLHVEGQIDDDSQGAAGPEHRRKLLVFGGEHADLARSRHHREPRHALPKQSEPAREIATQSAVDDIPDDPDPGPRPHRQSALPLLDRLDELAEHDAPSDRDERPPALLVELDRLQMRHVEDHRAVAGDGGGVG